MSFRERYLNRHILLDVGPVVVFFAVHHAAGLTTATAAVMIATVLAVALGWFLDRRVPALAIVTLILVLALGGASLIFADDTFIKIKPTVGNILFAAALLAGLRLSPSLLERTLAYQISITDRGWRVLTYRWCVFALLMAAANEVVWRNMTVDQWVAFKTGMTPVSILCYILITRITVPRFWVGDAPAGMDAKAP